MLESNKLKKSLAKIKCVDKAHAKSLGFFLKVVESVFSFFFSNPNQSRFKSQPFYLLSCYGDKIVFEQDSIYLNLRFLTVNWG